VSGSGASWGILCAGRCLEITLGNRLPVNAGGALKSIWRVSRFNPAARSSGGSCPNALSLLRREFAKLRSGVFIALGSGFGKIRPVTPNPL
jgi:hypothetical protein